MKTDNYNIILIVILGLFIAPVWTILLSVFGTVVYLLFKEEEYNEL
jgi:hypothetical protein